MIVVFTPPAKHIQQIARACRDAGIDYATAAQPVVLRKNCSVLILSAQYGW
jgi:hypothetical protein